MRLQANRDMQTMTTSGQSDRSRCMILILRVLITCAVFVSAGIRATASPTPEAVVQAQLQAYNARNIDAFLATYADDAQLFDLPNVLLMRGTAQMRDRYAKLFTDPLLHAEIVNRIVLGNTIIDHERVRLTLPDGPGMVEAIAIYEVRDGKITAVWFRRGDKKLDAAPAKP